MTGTLLCIQRLSIQQGPSKSGIRPQRILRKQLSRVDAGQELLGELWPEMVQGLHCAVRNCLHQFTDYSKGYCKLRKHEMTLNASDHVQVSHDALIEKRIKYRQSAYHAPTKHLPSLEPFQPTSDPCRQEGEYRLE